MKIKAIDRGNGNILGEWDLSGTRVGTRHTPSAAEALVRAFLSDEDRNNLRGFETRWDRGRQAWVVWVIFYPNRTEISDDDNQTFYEQAQEDVLGDKTFDQPCRYGHFDCSTVERGACSNEAISRRFDELLKGRA